ncbi:hypothetical protein [Luteibacter aegosomatissinici]|uniref:hypothetical protein n=1 Tax=Luteibacter aegosomatissinici TaxID=2911539 RepID=UPI001FF87735|nr:hypothetical protein [Luteibacter aegosomatissinici]UPG94111.1 hypothetical protein L2Y97_20165 [Luteibacter aegosomatissinici]
MDKVIGDDRGHVQSNPDTDKQMVANLSEGLYVDEVLPDIRTSADVDGVVTRLVVCDEITHLYLRDYRDRELKLLVSDSTLACDIAPHIQDGLVRVVADGYWQRLKPYGWLPKQGACYARSFVVLKTTPLAQILDEFTAIAADGWNALDDPMAAWKKLRGCK